MATKTNTSYTSNTAGNRTLPSPERDEPLTALDTRQAAFVARRFGIRADRARLVAPLIFGGGAR